MCIGIPGRVLRVDGRMAAVEVGGAVKDVALDLLDGVSPGEYVIAHAGFAIQKIDEAEAAETLRTLREIADAMSGAEGPDGRGAP